MKRNVGNLDKILRVIVGLALISLSVTNTRGWWGYLGFIPLIGGLIGYCPLYSILGISTTKKQ